MTVAPDEGMALLARQMYHGASGAAPETPAAAAPPEAGLELEGGFVVRVLAKIGTSADSMAAAAAKLAAAGMVPWEAVHPFLLPPNQSAAAGTIDDPDRWGPRAGWAWVLTRATGVLNTGGTSWTLYRDAAMPTNTLIGPVPSGIWEPKSCIILPGQRVLASSAGAGVAVNGEGVEVDINWLARFLM